MNECRVPADWLVRTTYRHNTNSIIMTLPHSIIHINEGLRLRFINISFHYNVQFLNVKSIFYLNVMNREEIIRNVLYLEVASLWRHHHPQQQHQGWRAANKWSDGNENSLYRNTAFTVVHKYTIHYTVYIYIYIYMRATTIFTVSTGDMY